MYNKMNLDPTIIDLRCLEAFESLHLHGVSWVDVSKPSAEFASNFQSAIADMSDNFNNLVLIVTDLEEFPYAQKVHEAVSTLPHPFSAVWRFHAVAALCDFAPFLFTHPFRGAPSLLECFLPEHIFLGAAHHLDATIVQSLRIKQIINITPNRPAHPEITRSFPIDDAATENLSPVLSETGDILRTCVEQHHAVFVHCQQGVSRSVSVVVDFLARIKQIDPDTALALVQASRPQASPNDGFMRQLRARNANRAAGK